jgi:hypothetical protein
MPRSLKGVLGPWAARIRFLQKCSAAVELLNPNNPDAITLSEEVIEDATKNVLDDIARDLQARGVTHWYRWAIEALFHPEVRSLLSPTFFLFFKVGNRVGEGDLRFVDEILHGTAFGPKAALVWWTYCIDRQRGLEARRQYEADNADRIGMMEEDVVDFVADPEFVSEDARSFARLILEQTERRLSPDAHAVFRSSSATYSSWLSLTSLSKFTESLTRTQFYEGRTGEQGRRQEGAFALAQSYYNEACRLDRPQRIYKFLTEPY